MAVGTGGPVGSERGCGIVGLRGLREAVGPGPAVEPERGSGA